MRNDSVKKCVFGIAIIFFFFSMTVISHAQPWSELLPEQKVKDQSLTFFDYQKAFEDYWAPYQVEDGYYMVNGERQKAGGWKQFLRWEWYWEQRVDPITGEFPKVSALDVFAEHEAKRGVASTGNWTTMGPSATNGGYAGLGRLNAIGFHPTDANTFYVAAASGGVWKTVNGGSSWIPISDTIASLGMSDIIVLETTGDDILYIATGDRDHSDAYSIGVLKSIDGGVSWNETGLDWTQDQNRLVNRLLIDRDAPDTLYAATSVGLYQTTDGGNSWTMKTSNNFIDIEFQPGNTGQIYGSNKDGEIYRSTDHADSWTMVINTNGKRTDLAVTEDNDDIVYAVQANSSNGLYGVYKSTNGGSSFSQVFSGGTTNLLDWSCDGSGSGGQGWYDLSIACDPNDEEVVFLGGINTWKTEDGGFTWNINTHWSGTCSGQATTVHADKHFHAYQNNTSNLFECNDGGLYKTEDGGSSWDHLGNGLVTSQIYRLGVAQTVDDDVIIGLQDNGSKALLGGSWDDVIGGDGMECLIDYTNENTQYGSLYYGNIKRTTNHWSSYSTISNGISGSAAWVTPYIIDKNDNETLYVGYQDVWKSTNRGNSWTKISDWSGNTLRSLTIGDNSDYICAATYNTLYRTTDGGAAWTDISSGLPTSSASITYVTIKAGDENSIWVSFSGFNADGVYESTDGGSSWTNSSTGLPQLPVNCIIEDTSADEVTLYAGTDVGIYVKEADGTWSLFNNNLPNVVINELEIYYAANDANSRIRAATYGRGLWESPMYTTAPPPVSDFIADNTTPYTFDTVTFTDLSQNSPSSWDWDTDPITVSYLDGTDQYSQNPKIRFNVEGLYTITMHASNAAGTSTETKVDYIDASALAPVADFTADTIHPNVSEQVSFTDLSNNAPTNWLWEFDPNNVIFEESTNENSKNPVVKFTMPGIYTVSLTSSNAGGADTETKTDYIDVVDILIVIASANPDNICKGDSSQLIAIPSGGEETYTYSWTSNPPGFTSDMQFVIVNPEVTTTYTVVVTDSLQTDSDQVSVQVNQLLVIELGDWPEDLCNEKEPPVQLTAEPPGGTYSGNAVTVDGLFSPEEAPLGWNVITYTYETTEGCINSALDSIFVDQCVGMFELDDNHNEFVIFPNPNTGEFELESNALIQSIEIMNQSGTVLHTARLDNRKATIKLSLKPGFYYLKARLDDGGKEKIVTKKVLVR